MRRLFGFTCYWLLILTNSAFAVTDYFAVILGNNRGHDPRRALNYAEADAKKVYQTLLEVGGVRPERTRLLLGVSADNAWHAVYDIAEEAKRLAQRNHSKTMFLLYYSGHADGNVLELGNTSLDFEQLVKFLREPGTTVRLAFIDACKSGNLVAIKGGRRGPAYDINISEDIRSSGYAIITSSTDNELSQESAEIRGSFFTHYLISGLRGAADESGDGKVTLNEAYRYAYSRTVARTSSSLGGAQHPMYQFKLTGQGEIILSQPQRMASYLSVTTAKDARLVVLNGRGDMVVAEAEALSGNTLRISLAPANYLVYLIQNDGIHRADVTIGHGQGVHLAGQAFRPYQSSTALAKGGLFYPKQEGWKQLIGAGMLLRNSAFSVDHVTFGASAYYALTSPGGWNPSIRISWSTPYHLEALKYFEVGVRLGLGYMWRLRPIDLSVGICSGYEHLFQTGQENYSAGFSYSGNLFFSTSFWPLAFYLGLEAGGRTFQLLDEGWVHRLDLQLLAGLGWKWQQ